MAKTLELPGHSRSKSQHQEGMGWQCGTGANKTPNVKAVELYGLLVFMGLSPRQCGDELVVIVDETEWIWNLYKTIRAD